MNTHTPTSFDLAQAMDAVINPIGNGVYSADLQTAMLAEILASDLRAYNIYVIMDPRVHTRIYFSDVTVPINIIPFAHQQGNGPRI